MHASTILSLFAVALSASAFEVTNPSSSSSWNQHGFNTLAWDRVSTDATNFTVVLTNTDRSILPINNQVLVSFVDASSDTTFSVDAPSGGFSVGGSYRINLVKSTSEITTIYSQSDEFDIVEGGDASQDSSSAAPSSTGTSSRSTSAGTTSSSATSRSAASSTPTTLSVTGSSGTSTSTSTSTDSSTSASSTSNAANSRQVGYGFLGAMLLMGGFLA